MLDKELMKKRFQKSLLTYSQNAHIQRYMAQKLACYIKKDYDNILEIGSYSGFLTNIAVNKINFKNYSALDITDSFNCIKNLSSKIKFYLGDIETFELLSNYDLIISSSSLQWCNDLKSVIQKLKSHLNRHGNIMIAIFGRKNFFQIKDVFGVSLNYPDISQLREMFSSHALIFEETKTLKFDNPYELLRHLKNTGVNSFKNTCTYSQMKEKLKILEDKYNNELTYNPLYIID